MREKDGRRQIPLKQMWIDAQAKKDHKLDRDERKMIRVIFWTVIPAAIGLLAWCIYEIFRLVH